MEIAMYDTAPREPSRHGVQDAREEEQLAKEDELRPKPFVRWAQARDGVVECERLALGFGRVACGFLRCVFDLSAASPLCSFVVPGVDLKGNRLGPHVLNAECVAYDVGGGTVVVLCQFAAAALSQGDVVDLADLLGATLAPNQAVLYSTVQQWRVVSESRSQLKVCRSLATDAWLKSNEATHAQLRQLAPSLEAPNVVDGVEAGVLAWFQAVGVPALLLISVEENNLGGTEAFQAWLPAQELLQGPGGKPNEQGELLQKFEQVLRSLLEADDSQLYR